MSTQKMYANISKLNISKPQAKLLENKFNFVISHRISKDFLKKKCLILHDFNHFRF